MTQMLERVVGRLSSLPEIEQDQYASFILSELDSESKWDSLFSNSQDVLARLAAEALAEDDAGLTEPMAFDCDISQNPKI
jgi:hypothetical protein